MHVKILGSAAGGGFPQWNCGCRNCSRLRAGTFPGKARSQAQVAVSGDGEHWFLLGTSPDLRYQIESSPVLHPKNGTRTTPIAGAVLAAADVDHVLGLLMLRELQPLRVYATDSVTRILREGNSMFGMLNRVPQQVEWTAITPGEKFDLRTAGGESCGLRCETFPLATHYPAYVGSEGGRLRAEEAVQGLIIESTGESSGKSVGKSVGESAGGKRLAFVPNVAAIDAPLLEKVAGAKLLLFDGTFWSDDELVRTQGSGQTARQMGHVPVSGSVGSLQQLSAVKCEQKMFIHINNTNPMLDETSLEHRAIIEAGWSLAEDGWQAEL